MKLRLLLSLALLTTLAASLRASFYFTWNAPNSVNVGQGYTVEVQAYFSPDYYDDPYADLWFYRNGSQIGSGSTGAYGTASASNSFNDGSPQTVNFSAETYSYYGETGYSSHAVMVTGAPANNPPTAWVTVDGHSHGATVTRPYGGSVTVTVRYKASDPDNNLARIRPQVWHPSGYLNNNGGNFIGQSGGYGEVAWNVTLNENGNWHFWTDAEDTNNVFVNSGAWGDGFRLTVVEGAPPNTPPTVTLHSPAAQTIYLNQALTITSQATDPDGNIANHNLDIQRPDGSWNWQGGFANGEPYTGGYSGSPANSNRSASFTFNQLGTWYVRSAAADPSGWYHSATVAINVVNDTTPPGAPANLQISSPTSSGFTLSWSAPAGEAVTGYRVRLNGGAFSEIGNVLSHPFSGLAANTAYNVEVQARDAQANWSSSASFGYNTGSGGSSGGTLPNASVWMDVDGDGIRDEIVRPKTEAFDFMVAVWFTTVVQYIGHPLNNFWTALDMLFSGGTAADFGWKFYDTAAQFYVNQSTHFGLVFDIYIEANQPFTLYRDLTGSDQIAPANWQYILGSSTGPAYTTTHEFFWEVPNPYQLVNSKYFVVKKGRPVGGMRFQLAGDATMDLNTSGVFGGLTLAGGVKITTGGGIAAVTGFGNVSANGTLTLPDGTVVAVNSIGEASITLSNGVQVNVNTQGKVSLTVPSGLTGITARVLDVAGRILDVANNGVIFSAKDAIGQIINLPSGGILDALPDIGLNVLTGQILIGGRIGSQSEAMATWIPFEGISMGFVKADGTSTNTLKVAKWENAFSADSTPQLKSNFLDLDPDRFYLQMIDGARKGLGTVNVTLSTKKAAGDVLDDATTIQLTETGGNTGVFRSQTMILVSDDVDDAADGTDNRTNDRTHKVELGGKVKVDYAFVSGLAATREAPIPIVKTVDVHVVILRQTPGGSPVISQEAVQNAWKIAQERYAQIGVKLNLAGGIQVKDPPAGVDLGDGLTARASAAYVLTAEAKALIGAYGTTNSLDDIHVFYVNTLTADGASIGGLAVMDGVYEQSEQSYLDNVFITNNASMPWAGYALAHELTHVLTKHGHADGIKWRLMFDGSLQVTGVTASKRLIQTEETTIQQNSRHAH